MLIAYAQRENEEVVKFRFGFILTLIVLALIVSPLISLNKIIRTKNTHALPVPLILSGTIVAFLWFLYGLIIGDFFGVVQNFIALSLNAFQLGLLVYCRFATNNEKCRKIEKITFPKNQTKVE